jgi:hypothetical protein
MAEGETLRSISNTNTSYRAGARQAQTPTCGTRARTSMSPTAPPGYMRGTCYQEHKSMGRPRYSQPCAKLQKRNLNATYHDPADSNAGEVITLSSFLGINNRGSKKLEILQKKVKRDNTTRRGESCGRGNLGPEGRVQLNSNLEHSHVENIDFHPQERVTIFGGDQIGNRDFENIRMRQVKKPRTSQASNSEIAGFLKRKLTMNVSTSYRVRKAQHDAGTTVFGKSVVSCSSGGCSKIKSSENVPDSIKKYSLKLKQSLQVKQREKQRYEIQLIKTYAPDKQRFHSFIKSIPAYCMDDDIKAQLVSSKDDAT